jgi:hypothetical protein
LTADRAWLALGLAALAGMLAALGPAGLIPGLRG